jgi:flagellar hook-associated protein 2
VVGIGTLDISMGQWNNMSTAFQTNPNWPKASITVNAQDNTLEKVRDRINAAGVGVVATLMTDATGTRLVLSAAHTGADNGFRIDASPSDSAAAAADSAGISLSQLAFNPALGTAGLQMIQPASNAQVSVDDQPFESPGNVIDVPQKGLQIRIKAPTDGEVELNVSSDQEGLSRKLKDWGDGVNRLRRQVLNDGTSETPSATPALREARQVLDVISNDLTGSNANAWSTIGVGWSDSQGVEQRTVAMTADHRQVAHQLFSQLSQHLGVGQAAKPDADALDTPAGSSVPAAGVQLNRQRLQDHYLDASHAVSDASRQGQSML